MEGSTLEGISTMKRFTFLAAALVMMIGATGCSVNQCNSCGPKGGLLSKLRAPRCNSDGCNVATGCRTCGIGWQHGGLDYSEGLATGRPCYSQPGAQSPEVMGSAGPASAAVAYPYYTVRGPRDFLLNNPPTIGR